MLGYEDKDKMLRYFMQLSQRNSDLAAFLIDKLMKNAPSTVHKYFTNMRDFYLIIQGEHQRYKNDLTLKEINTVFLQEFRFKPTKDITAEDVRNYVVEYGKGLAYPIKQRDIRTVRMFFEHACKPLHITEGRVPKPEYLDPRNPFDDALRKYPEVRQFFNNKSPAHKRYDIEDIDEPSIVRYLKSRYDIGNGSANTYKIILNNFWEFTREHIGISHLTDMTRPMAEESVGAYMNHIKNVKGLASETLHGYQIAILTMFNYLHKMEIIGYDMRDFGRMHRIKNGGRLQEKRWIDHDKVTDFIAFVDDETYRLCFRIMYDTGARVGEVCTNTKEERLSHTGRGIKVSDIDFGNEKVFLGSTKSGDEQILYSSEDTELFKDIKKYIDRHGLAGDDYLFQMIAPTTANNCRKYVQAYRVSRNDPDFECTPHMFRHSRARRLVTLGIELPTIQRFMRHKNLTPTQQYVTAVEDDILNMRETVRTSKPS